MPDLHLGHHDDDSSVEVAVGELVVLTLPENASTGYQWDVASFSDAVLALDDVDRTSATSETPGGGSTVAVIRLRAIAGGEGTVALKHWRGYETDDAVTMYRLRVRVTDGGPEEDP